MPAIWLEAIEILKKIIKCGAAWKNRSRKLVPGGSGLSWDFSVGDHMMVKLKW